MRLFLFPISNRHTLIYAQRLNLQLTTETTYVEKITGKATSQWVKWEAAESGWQKKVTEWGNSAFARIPYQEWGLKSVPPLSTRRKAEEIKSAKEISVRFPENIIPSASVNGLLRKLATERQALHRKSMWWSIAGLPVALPFGVVPIVPNLPFIYLVFRAWSHWRALNGSKHIEFLLDNNLIKPTPSKILRKVYELRSLPNDQMQALKNVPTADVEDSVRVRVVNEILDSAKPTPANGDALPKADGSTEMLFLPKGSGKLVSRSIGLVGLDIEIERALAQVGRLIGKDKERTDEKQSLDEASGKDKQG